MILFTLLGLSTGFDKEKYHEAIFDNCNSGLEKYKITKHPKIFKNSQFLADIGDMTMNLKMIGS